MRRGRDSLQAGFSSIKGLALDGSGNLYVADGGVVIRNSSPPSAYLTIQL